MQSIDWDHEIDPIVALLRGGQIVEADRLLVATALRLERGTKNVAGRVLRVLLDTESPALTDSLANWAAGQLQAGVGSGLRPAREQEHPAIAWARAAGRRRTVPTS